MAVLDKRGKPIVVGAYIVYGHALGRCAGLRFGKVLAVKETVRQDRSMSPYSIRVIGVDDDWSTREPKLCSRPGNLMFPDRIIVLEAADMPDVHLRLLDEYTGEPEETKSAWERL